MFHAGSVAYVCMYVCCGFAVLTSCSQEDMSRNLYPGGDASPSGTPVAFSIRLQDTPGYNAPEGNAPSTRSGEKLIAEWVKVNSFSVTRSGQERDEDFPGLPPWSCSRIRFPSADTGVMGSGIYFRLFVFTKSGSSYVFRSVADYTSGGGSAPVLKQGSVKVNMGETVRFVAYSFNNGTALGALPTSCD